MITFFIVALILIWLDMKWLKWTGRHISLVFPILAFSLILPSWIIFPMLVLYLVKQIIEWRH